MSRSIRHLFTNITKNEPPDGLYEAILISVRKAEQKKARIRFTSFSVLCTVSISAFGTALHATASSLSQSGFLEYFSLIFTDGQSVLFSYGRDYLMTLVDTIPFLELSAASAAALAVIALARFAAISAKDAALNHLFTYSRIS